MALTIELACRTSAERWGLRHDPYDTLAVRSGKLSIVTAHLFVVLRSSLYVPMHKRTRMLAAAARTGSKPNQSRCPARTRRVRSTQLAVLLSSAAATVSKKDYCAIINANIVRFPHRYILRCCPPCGIQSHIEYQISGIGVTSTECCLPGADAVIPRTGTHVP